MDNKINIAFESKCENISLDDIVLTKTVKSKIKSSRKYQQISTSIIEIGIIEPPVVIKSKDHASKYLLLDGHLRISVLKDLGKKSAICLIAMEDEAYTYNKQINRLAAVQEHKMILQAIKSGVSEDRLAKALNVNIRTIKQKRSLLDGICTEAVQLLKDRDCPGYTFEVLKKMKPVRQVEVVELMIALNNFTRSYAKATLIATPSDLLVRASKSKNFKGVSSEQIAQMESEMSRLQQQINLISDNYGTDHLNLVLTTRYVTSLMKNSKILRYLEQNHAGITTELQQISGAVSIGT